MRQRLTIIIAILVFLGVVGLMLKDMFQRQELLKNPYEYSLDDYKDVKEDQIGYNLVDRINSDFKKLKAIAIDHLDQIYIADSNEIKVYGKNLELKTSFEKEEQIQCITIDKEGKIFLGIGGQVDILDSEGKLISSLKEFSGKSYITSIAVIEENIYVADAGIKLILKYDMSGRLLNEIGGKQLPDRKFGFVIPSAYFDIAEGREGQIWVVNPGMHTFEAYNSDGKMISSWKKTSMDLDGFSGCCNPTHFAMLNDGAFVTSEKGLVRIKVHEPTGAFRTAIAGPHDFDEKEVGIDLAVNSEQEIFVLVPSKKEIRKYRKK